MNWRWLEAIYYCTPVFFFGLLFIFISSIFLLREFFTSKINKKRLMFWICFIPPFMFASGLLTKRPENAFLEGFRMRLQADSPLGMKKVIEELQNNSDIAEFRSLKSDEIPTYLKQIYPKGGLNVQILQRMEGTNSFRVSWGGPHIRWGMIFGNPIVISAAHSHFRLRIDDNLILFVD